MGSQHAKPRGGGATDLPTSLVDLEIALVTSADEVFSWEKA